MLIDFDKAEEKANKFLGSERKTTVSYNGEIYMLKYPDPVRAGRFKEELSYKNNQFSEYIGSQIFKSCGFITQDTLLGKFTDKSSGKEKIVVACKDFTQDGSVLYEFAKFANQSLVEKKEKFVSIEDVYSVVDTTSSITDKADVIERFWDMFVIDALIGNRDRHFGNWGMIEKDGVFIFSPIYDCGSSLSALMDDEIMKHEINEPVKFKQNVYNVTSCYRMNNNRIFYHEIFSNPPQGLQEAIKRIVPRIDMDKVTSIIDNTPAMSDIRKEYLKKAVDMRYTQIILPALKRVQSNEKAE